ncbi:hypothetical protein [Sediminibacillus albus]|uniref:Uncharacterized protein n=1 Tax=Sediminibacillus albus TaxID=407036 RepID=A0A1G8X3T7_9BACI|nr:hypothetical protein [Sediminibacillus albus]SDJ85299.1 hypothetical protein SAMN05216243_1147 [Sediminibacillus albus]
MVTKAQILNATKYTGGIVLTAGIMMFMFGFFASGPSILTPIGIGTVMGAVFIFLMGVFFVATEETLEKIAHHKQIVPTMQKK